MRSYRETAAPEQTAMLNMDFSEKIVAITAEQDWLSSPHMSRHHPLVEKETMIWVKVGH